MVRCAPRVPLIVLVGFDLRTRLAFGHMHTLFCLFTTGFYEFVALPLAHALTTAFPGAAPLMRCFESNYLHWKAVDAAAAAAAPASPAAGLTATSSTLVRAHPPEHGRREA